MSTTPRKTIDVTGIGRVFVDTNEAAVRVYGAGEPRLGALKPVSSDEQHHAAALRSRDDSYWLYPVSLDDSGHVEFYELVKLVRGYETAGGSIRFGFYEPGGDVIASDVAEFLMSWENLGGREVMKLQMAGNSVGALQKFSDVFGRIGELPNAEQMTREELVSIFQACGLHCMNGG